MAGIPTKADDEITTVITCKYMGWDWETYMNQPITFLQTVKLFRQLEAEEAERLNKRNGSNN